MTQTQPPFADPSFRPGRPITPWRDAYRAAPAAPRARWWSAIDPDGVFAFAMFLPMAFVLQLGSKGAAAFVLATVVYAALRWREAGAILTPRLFLFIPAGLACFSTLWSEAPKESLKHGLELSVTLLAAATLSSARRPDMVLRGIAAAFAVYVAVSLAFGGTVAVGLRGQTAFSGLSDSKNLVADIASTGLLVALGAAWLAACKRSWWWAAGLAAAAAMEALVIANARSAGAMLGLGVGLGAFLALALLRPLPTAMRGALTLVLGLLVTVVAVFFRSISQAMVDFATVAFDKDPTLTGRTYLWARGFDLINERPLLGRGFYAFWLQGNPDAEGLWRYGGIVDRTGFTFHNSAVEVLIQLGWAGLAILAGVMLAGIFCFAVRFVRRPNLALCVWGGLLMYELVRMPIESIGYAPFFFSTVLITGALGMAFSPEPESAAPKAKAARPARVAAVIPLREFDRRRRSP